MWHGFTRSHPNTCIATYIIHLCSLHMRFPSPGKHYQLVVFVKFLKKNPCVFEWPGVDLSLTHGGDTLSSGGEVMGMLTNLYCRVKLFIGSASGVLLAGADPPLLPCVGVVLRSHQYPGVYATVLLYWRPSKPRVR